MEAILSACKVSGKVRVTLNISSISEEALLEKTKAGFRIDTGSHVKVRNWQDIDEEEDEIVYEAFQ
jgi:hypothetical protein